MNEYEVMAHELCDKYGITLFYAREAVWMITGMDMTENEAIAEIRDIYGDIIYA